MLILEIISSICKVVMFLTTCYLFIFGLSVFLKEKSVTQLWILSILSLADSVIYLIYVIYNRDLETYSAITKWWQLSYILAEFYIITNFLIGVNKIRFKRSIMISFGFILITLFLITLFFNWDFKEKYYSIITLIELVFINSFAIRYLLIVSPLELDYKQKCITGLVKGTFLFINISSPYLVIIQFIIDNPGSTLSSLSFINDLAYTILFIYIFNSIRCQIKK